MQNANTNEINSLSSSRRIAWTASFSSLSSLALPFQRNGFFFLLLPSSLLPLVRIFISLLGFVLWRLPNWLGAKIAVVMNESRVGWVTERIQGAAAAAAGCVCVVALTLINNVRSGQVQVISSAAARNATCRPKRSPCANVLHKRHHNEVARVIGEIVR